MTSSSDTFPFGIADVVELLGLTVRRRLPSSLYLNCPFCGDQRGRLNVNTDKNVWRCNRCGAAGGMLALYARHNCTGNADAYREICEALGRYTPRPRVNDCIGVKPGQNARAAPQEIHQTYSLLLSMLPLTPTHKAHLLSPRRGLTEEQIARFGFKSTPPAFLCRSYDMKDKSVLFPKNCAAAHDREAERIQKINDAQKKKAFCMAYAGFARKAALSNKELQIVCPKQANDLVDEGKALHHCVGGYIDSVAEGRSLIVFVRRVEEPKKPYVTVEVRDGKIAQIHGDHNSAPTEEVQKFVDLWSRKVLPIALQVA